MTLWRFSFQKTARTITTKPIHYSAESEQFDEPNPIDSEDTKSTQNEQHNYGKGYISLDQERPIPHVSDEEQDGDEQSNLLAEGQTDEHDVQTLLDTEEWHDNGQDMLEWSKSFLQSISIGEIEELALEFETPTTPHDRGFRVKLGDTTYHHQHTSKDTLEELVKPSNDTLAPKLSVHGSCKKNTIATEIMYVQRDVIGQIEIGTYVKHSKMDKVLSPGYAQLAHTHEPVFENNTCVWLLVVDQLPTTPG